ncbi:HD-GYP domain-containing protein [Thermodesulforhabdus norvegica]|uniref:HD-GYP domain-containing protein n=1 Tax=Thermodesulforhabdus norvegica TaxID=39841 RepID=UPI001FDECD9C|nr:HD-GYP domain-containing protein [Thermodesulforhabdus norvegica]
MLGKVLESIVSILGGEKRRKKDLRVISAADIRVGMKVRIPLNWFRHPFWKSTVYIRNQEDVERILALELPFLLEVVDRKDTQPGKDAGESERPEDDKEAMTAEDDVAGEVHETDRSLSASASSVPEKKAFSAKVHHLKVQQCQKAYHEKLVEIKKLIQGVLSFSEETVKEANRTIEVMVSSLLADPEAVVFLINAKKKADVIFHHALNTCMLALLLGRDAGLTGESLCHLGVGVLFHDIGKLRIPKSILYKEKPLTPAEKQFYRLHPDYGVEIASRVSGISPEATMIIRDHHELLDGTGYPRGLTEKEINTLVRITTIVNLYDNYCNPRNPERAFTPHAALAHMYRKLSQKLDRLLLERFIRLMGVFPPGTLVELNTGDVGVVIARAHWSPKHVSVMLYDPNVPSSKAPIVSIGESPEVKIIRSLRPADIPPEVYQYLSPSFRVSYMLDTWTK